MTVASIKGRPVRTKLDEEGSVSEGFKGQLDTGKRVTCFTHDPRRLPFPKKE